MDNVLDASAFLKQRHTAHDARDPLVILRLAHSSGLPRYDWNPAQHNEHKICA